MHVPGRTRWFQFSLSSLFLLMTAVAVWYGLGPPLRAWWAVRQLANDQIIFAGSHSGFGVGMRDLPAQRLRELGKRANPALLQALSDPTRFAAAHVLLCEINGAGLPVVSPLPVDMTEVQFDHLRIKLLGEGQIDFPVEQMPHLERYWSNRLQNPKESSNSIAPP